MAVAPDLWSDGVRLHIITAEPGDIKQKLLDRGVPAPPDYVMISSDPERKLLAEPKETLYHWRLNTDHPPDYEMVNPALAVFDLATGEMIKEMFWSWKTMGVPDDEIDEMTNVNGVSMILYRPLISDLRAAIKERRQVALAGTQHMVHALAGYVAQGDNMFYFNTPLGGFGFPPPLPKPLRSKTGLLVSAAVLAALVVAKLRK